MRFSLFATAETPLQIWLQSRIDAIQGNLEFAAARGSDYEIDVWQNCIQFYKKIKFSKNNTFTDDLRKQFTKLEDMIKCLCYQNAKASYYTLSILKDRLGQCRDNAQKLILKLAIEFMTVKIKLLRIDITLVQQSIAAELKFPWLSDLVRMELLQKRHKLDDYACVELQYIDNKFQVDFLCAEPHLIKCELLSELTVIIGDDYELANNALVTPAYTSALVRTERFVAQALMSVADCQIVMSEALDDDDTVVDAKLQPI